MRRRGKRGRWREGLLNPEPYLKEVCVTIISVIAIPSTCNENIEGQCKGLQKQHRDRDSDTRIHWELVIQEVFCCCLFIPCSKNSTLCKMVLNKCCKRIYSSQFLSNENSPICS